MAKPVLTVTFPDGTKGKRQSARPYAFVVVAAPRSPEQIATIADRDAERAEHRARALRRMAETPEVTIKSRGFSRAGQDPDVNYLGEPDFHGFEVRLTGSEWVADHANSKGLVERMTDTKGEDGRWGREIVPAREALVAHALSLAAQADSEAAKHRARAAAQRAGEVAPETYTALQWTSRYELGVKSSEAKYARERGFEVLILPVD